MPERVNPHMVTLARDARAITQEELAERSGIGQGTLSKYENSALPIPDDFVNILSHTLKYPTGFFYEQGRPYGFPPFHYRKRKKLSAKTLGRIIAEMNIRRIHIAKLARSFDLKTNRSIPEIDMDEYQGQSRRRPNIEDIARAVRELWMLPRGPIPNMVELLEENGAIVVPCDFQTDLIDAMSQRIDGMPVLFFININSPPDRIRYTLAHELGHMALHTVSVKEDDVMEDEADHFAGAFLLPSDEIKIQLRQFNLRHLANMKGYWKVSMQAIAYRADRLKLITPYQSKTFWIEMGRLGYRKREPNEPPKETPNLLRRMVAFHQRQLGYSTADLAHLLCLEIDEFRAMYDPAILAPRRKPALRLIK